MKDKIPSIMNFGIRCHVCGNHAIDMVPGYEMLRRVTSDCRSWLPGGRLGVCRICGSVQKVVDQVWQTEVEHIYEAYAIYHQSGGVEQSAFDQGSGQASFRSYRLLARLQTHIQLPETGRLLDIGCGNGALLRAFSNSAPLWSLVGTELTDKYRQVVESIDRVYALYTCAPDQVPGTFDAITMIHVLEHIPGPRDFLTRLWNKLKFDGLLVVEIPYYCQNPFDLLIADHCTHFSVATATDLIRAAGYEVVIVSTDWVPKELTIVARKTEHQQKNCSKISTSASFDSVVRSLQWLESVVTAAREVSATGSFGLFGTSVAGTWLFSELRELVLFFVDEDPYRAGKIYMGLPIYHPQDIPRGANVFLALPEKIARDVFRRLSNKYVKFHMPPLFKINIS